ncbi:hypothetical protein K458DRAFT_482124 [Lentithecium fluviatile CBS 122367]|uniref:Rhodopsin domain-containing protein n=1 Tax=Lentithecium fluviatile CBS 122367 TaxID=1168545 RepID=A0A6G1ICB3_9PLEO|nr:hypothetical protein K458DRAFT_482124 [Lentithecium fluviatile CBS 122367]
MSVTWRAGVEKAMRRQAPPGMPPLTPEYIAYTNAPEILAITGSFFAAAALIVALRCYVRIAMLKVFGLDDWIMVFAMLLATACFICFKIEADYGLGKHFFVILADTAGYSKFAKVLYIHSIIIMVGISSVKISIAFFLLRLTGIASKTPYSRFLYGVIAFMVLLTLACAGTLIFQCLPVEAIWNLPLRPPPFGTGDAVCYSNTTFRNLGLMNSSFNIITDVLFATIPIPLIWQLQLNIRTKISLIAVLSLGWFACAAAIIKAILQWNVLEDLDWTVHDSFNVWNYIEFTIGIIAASLPSLKPLFNWFLEAARAITSGSRSKGTGRASAYKNRNSLGYQDVGDRSDKSINLQSFTSRGASSNTSGNPYNVRITTSHTGLADKEAWDMVHAKNSDESIRPLQPPVVAHNGILMTKEVRVS